jgi:hypothetical protein
VFTPQPGTGCLTQNPQFTDPNQNNFNLLPNSACIAAGFDSYDIGACIYNEIPESPQFFELVYHGNESLQIHMRWKNPDQTTHGNTLDSIATIKIWRNDSLIQVLQNNTNSDTLVYTDIVERPDYYRYQICVTDTNGNMGRKLYTNEMWLGGSINGIIIWDLDKTPITGQEISNALSKIGYNRDVYKADYSAHYPLESSVEAVFVCLGVYDNNHILSDAEGQLLADYLNNGGRLYMESGDTWYFDPQTVVHPFFEINPIADGADDLFHVSGESGTIYDQMYFDYAGENAWMDQIEPTVSGFRILNNPDLSVGVSVAYDAGTYKTIGTSFEFGGLVDVQDPSTKSELIKRILYFFDIDIISGTDPEENKTIIPEKFIVHQNYPNPFNSTTVFEIAIPEKGNLQLQIFNITGKKIYEQNIGDINPVVYKIKWNGLSNSGKQVASSIYFYRVIFTGISGLKYMQTRKMMLLR